MQTWLPQVHRNSGPSTIAMNGGIMVRVFAVVAGAEGWMVRDNAGLRTTRHATRDEAIMEGHRVALSNQPCRLVVTARTAHSSMT
jgi:hypothetical protein